MRSIAAFAVPINVFDPAAQDWFNRVEASGANFGSTSQAANTNKTAFSEWVKALRKQPSPVAGKSNWDQLTVPNEGYIQPLVGTSTFNVPPLFGPTSTFTGFVGGDYTQLLGLTGGTGRVITNPYTWAVTPLDDCSAGIYVSTSATDSSSANRLFGTLATPTVVYQSSGATRCKLSASSSAGGSIDTRVGLASMSRSNSVDYNKTNGNNTVTNVVGASISNPTSTQSFFAQGAAAASPTTRTGSLVFSGRSVDLAAIHDSYAILMASLV